MFGNKCFDVDDANNIIITAYDMLVHLVFTS